MSLAVETEFGREARALPRRALQFVDVGPTLSGDPAAIESLAQTWREV